MFWVHVQEVCSDRSLADTAEGEPHDTVHNSVDNYSATPLPV